jgi:hypothetical protein
MDGLIKTCCSIDAEGNRCLETPAHWIKINDNLMLYLCARCYQVVIETMWNDAVAAARQSINPTEYVTDRRSGLSYPLTKKDQGD